MANNGKGPLSMLWRLVLVFLTFSLVPAVAIALFVSGHLGRTVGVETTFDVVVLAIVVFAATLLPAIWMAGQFVKPFHALTLGARQIAAGGYGHRIHGGAMNESRDLAVDFNRMSKRLAEQFEQLQTDREQLRTILGGMVEGVIAVDATQHVLFANESAAQMLRFDVSTIVGRLFPETTRLPQIQDLLDKALTGNDPRRQEIETNGSAVRRLAIYASRMGDRQPPGAVLVFHDITELRRLERVRQEFAANVSHELKTPLAIIQSQVEALLDGAADDVDVRDSFLQQIAEQSHRLYSLIIDLLRLSSLDGHEEVLVLEPVSVHGAVRECLERHQLRADGRGITLESAAPKVNGIRVRADEEALSHILDNLVDNAVKYTQEGGRIRIAWDRVAEGVNLVVEDNGPGIPERDLSRIFERFCRVDKARSREMGGTGLGLSIVKHLSQALRGNVRVSSELGRGTSFTVTLPVA